MKLGDAIAFVTKWTGIHWLTKKFFPDCGCERRRVKWNTLFSTRNKDFSANTDDIIFD